MRDQYHIAGKFGGNNVWQIDSYKLVGEEKFGKWCSTKNNYCDEEKLANGSQPKIIIAWSIASFYAIQ